MLINDLYYNLNNYNENNQCNFEIKNFHIANKGQDLIFKQIFLSKYGIFTFLVIIFSFIDYKIKLFYQNLNLKI